MPSPPPLPPLPSAAGAGADAGRRYVGSVFTTVARRYELMNTLMSLGLHRWWRRALLDAAFVRPGATLLDVAGGAGALAALFLAEDGKACARAIVCDPSLAMMVCGRERSWSVREEGRGRLAWLSGEAERLPLRDACVDIVTIAFGLRNTWDYRRALAEMYRVLKPGGRFLCLELGRVKAPGLSALYELYTARVLPVLGRIVGGSRDAYRYLAASIQAFAPRASVLEAMAQAGFARATCRSLHGGVVDFYGAWRL